MCPLRGCMYPGIIHSHPLRNVKEMLELISLYFISYGLHVCVPLKFTYWNPNPHCGGWKEFGCRTQQNEDESASNVRVSGVLEGWLGHEGRTLFNGISALIGRNMRAHSLYTLQHVTTSSTQETGHHQPLDLLVPWYQTLSLQNYEK